MREGRIRPSLYGALVLNTLNVKENSMSRETRKRLIQAAIIFALYAVVFGVPSTMLSGDLIDIPVLGVVFGLPTCVLLGIIPPRTWSLPYGRVKEHSRLY